MLNIVIRAVRIRLNNGEKLEDILISYPKLTEEEINEIKREVENNG